MVSRGAENTVLITGYQAQGTLGRKLVEGASSVRIFSDDIQVNAHVRSIGGFSAHADQAAILNWLSSFKASPKQTFITHGELEAALALQSEMDCKLGWQAATNEFS